jgi:ABC-type Fe3+ transport system permease subunit
VTYGYILGALLFLPGWTDYLIARLRNRPRLRKITGNDNVSRRWQLLLSTLTIGFFLADLFYGGVHLLVWNRHFRSEIDKLLWRTSSLTILASGIPFAIGMLCLGIDSYPSPWADQIRHAKIDLNKGFLKRVWWDAGDIGTWLLVVLYVFCRTFIIVECFLDVFHLPDSAFEVPRWSQYFPHIG